MRLEEELVVLELAVGRGEAIGSGRRFPFALLRPKISIRCASNKELKAKVKERRAGTT